MKGREMENGSTLMDATFEMLGRVESQFDQLLTVKVGGIEMSLTEIVVHERV